MCDLKRRERKDMGGEQIWDSLLKGGGVHRKGTGVRKRCKNSGSTSISRKKVCKQGVYSHCGRVISLLSRKERRKQQRRKSTFGEEKKGRKKR